MQTSEELHIPQLKTAVPPSPVDRRSMTLSHAYSPASSSIVPLPFLSGATKAEQYERFLAFDRHKLKRPGAHFRNALKKTENMESILKQLNEHLLLLESSGKKVPFKRLSAFAEAFDRIIQSSGMFSPLLQRIKDAYDHHLELVLSRQKSPAMVHAALKPSPTPLGGRDLVLSPSPELVQLRRRVHQLEVQCRVLLKDNERLREDFSMKTEIHRREMEELQAPIIEEQQEDTAMDASSKSYASRVEELQLQVAEQREAIQSVSAQRSGRVPLSVCYQLEQCLREVEIETQKFQKYNEKLKQKIQDAESRLAGLLNSMNVRRSVTSKLWKGLQDTIAYQ